MPSSTETVVAFAWIESTLSPDPTLQSLAPGGIIQTFPLPGTTTPYMLVKYRSGKDFPVFGGGRAYSDMRFRVVVVGPIGSQQTLASAAARIETLLTVTSQTSVTGGIIIGSFRDQPASEDEWVDSAKYHLDGGEYCVMAKAS